MIQTTCWPRCLLRVVLVCAVIPAHGHSGASFFRQSNGWLLLRYRGGGSRVVDGKPSAAAEDPSTATGTTGLSTPPLPTVHWDAETLSGRQAFVEQLKSENATTRIRRQPVPSWKQSLPERLRRKGPKTLQKICLGSTDIYLLGTAHVSNDSSTDVQTLLEHVHPDCIFVELCDARIPLLVGDTCSSSAASANTSATATTVDPTIAKVSFWKRWQATQQAQGGDSGGTRTSRWQALSTVLLSRVQEDYAKELGVELGGEFRSAHAYWLEAAASAASSTATTSQDHVPSSKTPVHLVLGDRPLHLTIVRAWESLSFWPKVKLIMGLLWSSLRRPNPQEIRAWLESVMHEESDVLTKSFAELRHHFPTLYLTILSERDAWLAAKLVQTCRVLQLAPMAAPTDHLPYSPRRKTTIVAIVGAGHVPGICDWLTHGPTSTLGTTTSTTPERVLAELVTTRRWAHDDVVQHQAIPMWIHEVSALPDPSSMLITDEANAS
jgi:pheromone shutdown protein TraB